PTNSAKPASARSCSKSSRHKIPTPHVDSGPWKYKFSFSIRSYRLIGAAEMQEPPAWWNSFLDVPFNSAGTDFSPINDSLRVGGNTFSRAGAGELGTRTRLRVRDESDKFAIFSTADANPTLPSIMVSRYGSRLRIRN